VSNADQLYTPARKGPSFLSELPAAHEFSGLSAAGKALWVKTLKRNDRQDFHDIQWVGPVTAILRLYRLLLAVKSPNLSANAFDRMVAVIDGIIDGSELVAPNLERSRLPHWATRRLRAMILRQAVRMHQELVARYPQVVEKTRQRLRRSFERENGTLGVDADRRCVFAVAAFLPCMVGDRFDHADVRTVLHACHLTPANPVYWQPHRLLVAPYWFYQLLAPVPEIAVTVAVFLNANDLEAVAAIWDCDPASAFYDPATVAETVQMLSI